MQTRKRQGDERYPARRWQPRHGARNFANVVYEYELFGKKLRNNRVSIGEDLGNFEVDETLARYPVGTNVTVYYNPRNPKEAVLERDAPKGMWGCITTGVLGLAAAYLIAVFGFGKLYDALTSFWSPANATRVLFFSIFGLFIAMILETVRRGLATAQSWPVVQGRIEKSESSSSRALRTTTRADRARSRRSTSRCFCIRTPSTAAPTPAPISPEKHGDRELGRPRAARRRSLQGRQTVDVHYDPKKPTKPHSRRLNPRWFWFSGSSGAAPLRPAIYFGTR